jgi:hypothetical protein
LAAAAFVRRRQKWLTLKVRALKVASRLLRRRSAAAAADAGARFVAAQLGNTRND